MSSHRLQYIFLGILIGIAVFLLIDRVSFSGKGEEAIADPENYAEFIDFYRRFHQDSAFQMEHILFPLEGAPPRSDSSLLSAGEFKWQREDWRLHRDFTAGGDFERQLTPLSEDLIVEQIVHRSGEYIIRRRWARLGDEWYLIYYAGLQSR